jgi:hypothetical protein
MRGEKRFNEFKQMIFMVGLGLRHCTSAMSRTPRSNHAPPRFDSYNHHSAIDHSNLRATANLKTVAMLLYLLVLLAVDTTTAQTSLSQAGVSVQSTGALYISAVSGQDVFVNDISFEQTLRKISILEKTHALLLADVSTLTVQVSSIQAQQLSSVMTTTTSLTSTSILTTTKTATTSTTSTTATTAVTMTITTTNATTATSTTTITTTTTTTANSTCSVRQTPQDLTKYFSSFATFTSAGGTVFLVAHQVSASLVFRDVGDPGDGFVSHQTLWSAPGTYKVCTFKVGATQYVAMPFYSDGNTLDYRCELYIFNESTQLLVSAQNISTFGVMGVSAITAPNGETYLAVSNYRSQAGSWTIPSYVMRFNSTSKLFEHFQNITTIAAYPPEFFQFGSDTFLAIPFYSSIASSAIYKLNSTSGIFVFNQSIPTTDASHIKPWTRNSQQYLSAVNAGSKGYTDTFVFNRTLGQFVNLTSVTRLYSTNPIGADVVEIAGSAYMVVAPWGTDARIYHALTQFEQTQQVTLSSGFYYPHLFTLGLDTFLALANRIYKFCGGQFVLN